MALIHPQSCPCVKSELDLFSVPPTQSSVANGSWVSHHPVASLGGGPIEFVVSGSGEDYMDLANSYIQIQAKITNADGSNLADDAAVAPVNLWLHSLFSQVDLSLNEKLISSSANTYPYRAYIETLLSYGTEAKHSHLTTSLWYKDTPGHQSAIVGTDNKGLVARKQRTEQSKTVDMMGRLHLDLFCQERYLINGVDLRLRLVRSPDTFALMCVVGDDFRPKIVIQSATLFMRKVKLNPTVQLAHIKALERSPVKYPIRRVETKVVSVPKGNMTLNQENLILGQLPKRVVIGCVNNDAFNGNFTENPFLFGHRHINFVALYVDGQQLPAKPLQPDFENGLYTRSFANVFIGTGQMSQDEGNDLNWSDYALGYTLFAFDLTPDLAEVGGHFNVIKQGNLRLEIRFGKALAQTTNVIVYSEFENMIQIDRSRNVLFDFAA